MSVYLEAYGCTSNKSDAVLIKGILEENNYKIVKNPDDADVLIILTCTVIGTTEQRMLSKLRRYKKTGKKIIVSGCMASIQSKLIKSILPDSKLLPPQYSHHIIDLLENKKTSFSSKNKTSFSKKFDEIIAPIAIAEGCNFSCSYCITTLARGKLKSYPTVEIMQNVFSALEQGCREIQLTAQDTGSYGLDIHNNLGELLNKVCEINGRYRIRVGMMNPFTALKNLNSIVDAYKDPKIYKFLHLPVQSGDNNILEKMNRKYTIDDFKMIINKFRKRYLDITISTDVIVGFPTENDEQFKHTIDLIKEVKPDIVNITRFSARPFTGAKKMKGRIRTEIMKERSRALSEYCSNLSKQKNKNNIGRKFTVLITKKGKNNSFIGRTENYKPVVIKENVEIGEFLSVEIIDAASTYIVGRLI